MGTRQGSSRVTYDNLLGVSRGLSAWATYSSGCCLSSACVYMMLAGAKMDYWLLLGRVEVLARTARPKVTRHATHDCMPMSRDVADTFLLLCCSCMRYGLHSIREANPSLLSSQVRPTNPLWSQTTCGQSASLW